MKALLALLLLVGAASSASATAKSKDVDDVAVVESSKAFSLLLPAVALPYAIAVIAIAVPLAKAFVAHALKLLNLPFEGMVALYLVLYATLFTFPQLASLLTATSVFTARSASGESAADAPSATGHQFPMSGTLLDWVRNFVPDSWADAMSVAVPALKNPSTTHSYTTLPNERTTATETTSAVSTAEATSSATTTTTTTTPEGTTAMKVSSTTSNLIEEDLESPAVPEHRVVSSEGTSSSTRCSSFKVCESVSRLVKDYPVSAMLMSYLGDYLQGLKYERAVREGMAGLDCSSIYADCR